MSGASWRIVAGAKPGLGHYEAFNAHPAEFMLGAWRECGELAEFDLGGVRNVLLSSPAAYEAVFRAPDDQLSPSEPYRFMVPVFGEGIQFGAPLEIERQQVKMQSNALLADAPPEDQRTKVEAAVRLCPNRALKLHEAP
jgi:sterol 14-demethylase